MSLFLVGCNQSVQSKDGALGFQDEAPSIEESDDSDSTRFPGVNSQNEEEPLPPPEMEEPVEDGPAIAFSMGFSVQVGRTHSGQLLGPPFLGSLYSVHAVSTRGNTVIQSNGSFTYTPTINHTAVDYFTYKIVVGSEEVYGKATITVVATAMGASAAVVPVYGGERNPTSAAQRNYQAGSRSLMRDSRGLVWFVQEGKTDALGFVPQPGKNDAIRYMRSTSPWGRFDAQTVIQDGVPGPWLDRSGDVTELAAHFMLDDRIYSYGKSATDAEGKIDECVYNTRTLVGSCSKVATFLGDVSLPGFHAVGAAVSSARSRVVWVSNDFGVFYYLYKTGSSRSWSMGGPYYTACSTIRNGMARFISSLSLVMVAQCGGSTDRLMAGELRLGAAPRFFDLGGINASTPNYATAEIAPGVSGLRPSVVNRAYDIWIDPAQGVHVLAGTNTGFTAYFYRMAGEAWNARLSPDFLLSGKTNHARFMDSGSELSVVRGTDFYVNGARNHLVLDKFALSSGELPWDPGLASGPDRIFFDQWTIYLESRVFDSPGALFVESAGTQVVPVRSTELLFSGTASPYGRYLWQFIGF